MVKYCQHKPKDSPDKKLHVAGTSRDDAISISRRLYFYDAYCTLCAIVDDVKYIDYYI
jgi:hypothetical protein